MIVGARQGVVGLDSHHDPKARLNLAQMGALLVEDVEGHLRAGPHGDIVGRVADQRVFENAQDMQGNGCDRAHGPGAHAMRADRGRAFQHAGANALTRHFQQAEMGDSTDLDAGAVVLERLLHPALDGAVVAVLLHVDEVDHDEAGQIAQAKLAGDFVSRFHVGANSRVFDVVLAGRTPGIYVDGDQRFGLVDDDVAARLQGHHVREHGIELLLDAELGKDRLRLTPGLDVLGMARHEQAHEVLGLAMAFLASDQYLFHVLVVEVADGALDQRAFLIDQRRGGGLEGQFANGLPHAQEIFEVALDLGLGAACASGTQDDAHPFRNLEVLDEFLQALAIESICDLAGDAAASGGIGHQDRIAAGQREVGGEGCALVAALFLDDLDEQNLAALDDLLDLVLLAATGRTQGHLFHGVAADLLDVLFFLVVMLLVPGGAARMDILDIPEVLGGVAIRGVMFLDDSIAGFVHTNGVVVMDRGRFEFNHGRSRSFGYGLDDFLCRGNLDRCL